MMTDKEEANMDIDYIVMTALLAGGLAAVGTAVTLFARPALLELGKQLPLPSLYAPPPAPPQEGR